MYNNTNPTKPSLYYEYFIYFLILLKVVFIITTLTLKYYEFKYEKSPIKQHKLLIEDLKQFRERIEFIFVICMSGILISIFNPMHTKPIVVDNDTKMLLYLFGIFNILFAPWNIFFNENQWFTDFMNMIGVTRGDKKNVANSPYSYERNPISRYYNDSVYSGNIITQTPPEPLIPPKKLIKSNKTL